MPEVEKDGEVDNEEQHLKEEHRRGAPVLLPRTHLGAHANSHDQSSFQFFCW